MAKCIHHLSTFSADIQAIDKDAKDLVLNTETNVVFVQSSIFSRREYLQNVRQNNKPQQATHPSIYNWPNPRWRFAHPPPPNTIRNGAASVRDFLISCGFRLFRVDCWFSIYKCLRDQIKTKSVCIPLVELGGMRGFRCGAFHASPIKWTNGLLLNVTILYRNVPSSI